MPVYVYRCTDCDNKYEVFHKVKEIREDIICPECKSVNFRKLMAASNFGGLNTKQSDKFIPPCATGSCNPNKCELNY
jgi:putative FmdB family regulatory protein